MARDISPNISDSRRLAQVVAVLGRHGLGGLVEFFDLSRLSSNMRPSRPEALVDALRELGPVAVKLGQILAMRSDLLAPEWTTALARLHDRVPGVPFVEIAESLAQALGEDYRTYFQSIEHEPIAAGSIAQVHAGVRADGKPVIVKIRRPGIEAVVDADMRILRRIARIASRASPLIARQRPDELLAFFAESLDREMDLGSEARASEEIGSYLARFGVQTAGFDHEVSGRRLNIQERVDAIPATDPSALAEAGIDLSAVSRTYARAILSMILFSGRFHADPHPGNVLIRPDGTLVLIDFGAVGTLLPERRDELVRLSLAIARDDSDELAEVLLRWAGNPAVDRKALKGSLEQLVGKFRGSLLDQVDLSGVFADVFALLRIYELALPGDLALMMRTLLTAEGFVRRLDPQFDITSELAPIARQLLFQRASLAKLSRGARRTASSLARTLLDTPELVENLANIARSGYLPVRLDPRDIARLEMLSKAAPAHSYGLVAAALIVASAILAHLSLAAGTACAIAALCVLLFARMSRG